MLSGAAVTVFSRFIKIPPFIWIFMFTPQSGMIQAALGHFPTFGLVLT
jgi:hypothetical protein